jgi:amino acid transporter
MTATSQPKLVRAIGRLSLTALVVNGIVGSGIYGLPSEISRLLGTFGPWAYVFGALGIATVMACFAEVGSQFPECGGPYLYAREAYGQFWGILMGWLNWLVRLTSAAANANVFVDYLGRFLPAAGAAAGRGAVMLLLIGGLAVVNLRGVRLGAGVNTFLAGAKLIPLALFILLGIVLAHGPAPAPASAIFAAGTPSWGNWYTAILLLIFAYGGFETATFGMAEARDTRRDIPFALFAGIGIVFFVYTLIQVVTLRALGGAVGSKAPIADAALVFLGPAGGAFMMVGALLSVYGNLSGSLLNGPRLTYAMAERGDFPALLGAVGPRFRTPYVSIILYAFLTLALSVFGSFRWNAILAAVARLFTYASVCVAVLVLRRKQPHTDAFRLPLAPLWVWTGVLFLGAAATRMDRSSVLIIATTVVVSLANWLWARKRPAAGSA